MSVRLRPAAQMPKPKLPDIDYPWTPQLAYAVGLIATDGNLSSDGRHLTVKSADRQLLETFKTYLCLKNKISKERVRNCYRISFGSVQLYRWLNGIGIKPAKSLTIGKIKIPDKYFRDFLRGHLDGDGSIILYNDHYNFYRGRQYNNPRTYLYFLSASEKHIQWVRHKLTALTGISGALIKRVPKDKNRATIWCIKIARYESMSILKWLYYNKDLPCLMRKRRIAEKALTLGQNWQRKSYSLI